MAYISRPFQNNKNKKKSNNFLLGEKGVVSGINDVQTNQELPDSAQKQRRPTRSGVFTNLDKYINANREQSTKLAGNVSKKLGEKATSVRKNLENAQSEYRENVKRGGTDRNAGFVDSMVQRAGRSEITNDEQEKFSKMRDKEYQGPSSLQDRDDYSKLHRSFKKTEDQANSGSSAAGRFALLSEMYKKPSYTKGQKDLDSLLVGGTEKGRRKLDEMQGSYGNIASEFKNAEELSRKTAQTRKMETQQAKDDVQKALFGETGALDNLNESINAQVGRLKKEREESLAQLREQLKRGEVSRDLLNKSGQLSSDGVVDDDADIAGKNIYNLNLDDYIVDNPYEISRDTAMTKDEAARLQALALLAGRQESSYLTDSNLAGTASQANLIGFDQEKFDTDLAKVSSDYKSAHDSISSQLQQSQAQANSARQRYNEVTAEIARQQAAKKKSKKWHRKLRGKKTKNVDQNLYGMQSEAYAQLQAHEAQARQLQQQQNSLNEHYKYNRILNLIGE